jgi:plasmid replication initiation protein
MRVVVNVAYTAPDKGTGEGSEERIVFTGLFDFFDVSAEELTQRASLRFGLPRKLSPLLANSGRWGRIKAEIVCSMTSKYAIALYELIQLRANLDRSVETFTIERFRELMGVPPKSYERGNNFYQFVIVPALLEVNGLSDIGVQIELRRQHSRAPVTSVDVAWHKKQGDEFKSALRERQKSKLGRMARLKGMVENIKED